MGRYAERLTKEDLIKMGVTDVDLDNLVVYGPSGMPKTYSTNKQGYLTVNLYQLDKDGNKIEVPQIYHYRHKDGSEQTCMSYIWRCKTISLSRLLWAWAYGEAKKGMVIDHINNQHTYIEDYRLENLQEITPSENICKDRPWFNTRKTVVVNTRKNLEFYNNKLNDLVIKYELAKDNKDARLAHNLRSAISDTKSKIRYLLDKGEN